MSDKIFRLKMWRFGAFETEEFEVVKRTSKTVVIRIYHEVGDGFRDRFCDTRYNLVSNDYAFYNTKKEVNLAAENVIVNRITYYHERANELLERLKEVCSHRAIDNKGRCTRCTFRVLNPDDYCNGGG